MLDPKKIRKALKDRNLSRVASETGLEYSALWRFANNQVKRIDYHMVRALSAYLKQNP